MVAVAAVAFAGQAAADDVTAGITAAFPVSNQSCAT